MIYMFQYESWNITPVQYQKWGAEYEKICEKWEDDIGEWHEVYDPDLSVKEEGSGFRVEFYGDITNFGEEPEENAHVQ